MARSPIIAAYLATQNPAERGLLGEETPPRPRGAVVWAICANDDQVASMKSVAGRLTDDGENITLIATTATAHHASRLISPNTKRSTRAFIAHWKPQIVLWVGGPLEAAPLFEIRDSGIPMILAEATSRDIDKTIGRRVPGLMRNLLEGFCAIQTLDDETTARLVRSGADPTTTTTTGVLEAGAIPPAYVEAERLELSQSLGGRPMWYAADIPMAELMAVADAHRLAARRAHRTLLLVSPRTLADGIEMTRILRGDGFSVACRSADDPPRESTQIYVVDTGDGPGLWCRLSSITYLGGSLSDGETLDPFAPATVGSAVLSGPKVGDHKTQYNRLLAASALQHVGETRELGRAVESLLATDLAAQLAHSAWDATSRGADATNMLVNAIYGQLDKVDQ